MEDETYETYEDYERYIYIGIVILVIIIAAAIGTAIFYLKGYKKSTKEPKQQQQKP